jgi:MFS family permease
MRFKNQNQTKYTGKRMTKMGADGAGSSRLRVVLAASIGSALEWYDFFLYGTAAALVFGELFFPKSDPVVGTLLSFLTFGVGFVFRPLGGIIFGILGDRYGRKPVLVATLLMIGLGTTAIGFLPTYSQIGVWAPILLVAMRIVQGLGAGAEYGGAVIYLVENAPANHRGFWGGFAPLGVSVGNLLAAGAFALVSMLPHDALMSWGCSSRASFSSWSGSMSACESPKRPFSPKRSWRAASSKKIRRWKRCATIRATSWSFSALEWRKTDWAISFPFSGSAMSSRR